MGLFDWLKLVFIIQLFYGFSITMIVHALVMNPGFTESDFGLFINQRDALDVQDISDKLEGGTTSQFNVSTLDLGSLIYFSGNIFFDIIINSATAVPQMFTLLVEGLFMFFTGIDNDLKNTLKLLIFVTVTLMYVASLLSLILQTRSGKVI